MASLNIFLIVCGDNMHFHPLPGKAATIPYVEVVTVYYNTMRKNTNLTGETRYADKMTHKPITYKRL